MNTAEEIKSGCFYLIDILNRMYDKIMQNELSINRRDYGQQKDLSENR